MDDAGGASRLNSRGGRGPGVPLSRRQVLRAAGGGLAAVSAGSLAACSGGPVTNTSAKGSLNLLLWSHFVPAFDVYFDKWAQDWGTKNHVNVTVDHVQTQTVVTHFSSEVAAGTGHDLVQLQNDTQPAIFAPHLADLTDVRTKVGNANGGWLSLADFGQYNGQYITLPEFFIIYPGIYRTDLWSSIGAPPPTSYADLIKYGTELKAKGHIVGVGISAIDDSENAVMGMMFAHGATFVGKDGKTITFDSPETRDALNTAKQLYTKAMNSEVLSWTDSSNNDLLDSGVGSYILNPISAYRSAPVSIQDKCAFVRPPSGTLPGANTPTIQTWVMPKWSKVQDTAKKFLSDYYDQYQAAFVASTGYNMPFLKKFQAKPMPILGQGKFQVLQDGASWSRGTGWPGPPTPQAGQVATKYVISGVFSKYVTGAMGLNEAVSYGMSQLKTIYTA